MASSTVHLTITNELLKKRNFKDPDRLKLGAVVVDWGDKALAHFVILLDNGNKKVYDLDTFRERFAELIFKDDLYMGYYLHLVQDLLYRHYVYDGYNWDPSPENVKKIHKDYSIVNKYIIPKYCLKNDITIPDNFMDEAINSICRFDTYKMNKDLDMYFSYQEEGDIFFFTKEMTDEYISLAVDLCMKELDSLKNGKTCINLLDYAWENHTK